MKNYFQATDGTLFDTEEELDDYERGFKIKKQAEEERWNYPKY